MTNVVEEKKTLSPISEDYNARFREIIDREFPTLEGRQDPQHLVCTHGGGTSHGEKAIKLAKSFGMKLMPWQSEQVILALSVDADGHWLHSDVVLICPRQNGKSLILEVIVLYRLFHLGHQIVFSAHQWRTAKSIRNRLWRRIKSRPWAARRLVRNTASAGEAEMETAEGGKVQFSTRSNDMGRGFDEIDLLIIDEAYNLDSGEMDAVAPTQLAAKDPQTYYTSSAVNEFKHPKGDELSKVRHRALGGDEAGLLFAEFMAPEGSDPEDPETWKLANPSYGLVADEKKIRSLKNKLTDVGFEVEMLGWGRWFPDESSEAGSTLIDLAEWETKMTAPPARQGENAIGVDVTPDGDHAALAAAIRAGDGFFLSLHPLSAFDRAEVIDATKRTLTVNVENPPLAVALDPSGQCSTLVQPLEREGVWPEQLNGGQVSKAWELFRRLWEEGKITHDGNPRWAAAWEVAEERSKQGRYRSLERYAGDVSVLVAATFAVWVLIEFSEVEDVPVSKKKFVGAARPVKKVNVAASMQF